jgi:hypothetical protein
VIEDADGSNTYKMEVVQGAIHVLTSRKKGDETRLVCDTLQATGRWEVKITMEIFN